MPKSEVSYSALTCNYMETLGKKFEDYCNLKHDSNSASDLISLVHDSAPYSDAILTKLEEFPLMLNTLWLNKTNIYKSNPKTIFEQYLSIIQSIQTIKVEK
jgi:hypothetical protein